MNVYIYTLTDPVTLAVRYVGLTRYPKKRLTNTLHKAHTVHLRNWIGALKRIKLTPIMTIIETVSEDSCGDCEKKWIKVYQALSTRLLNYTDGGERAYRVSDETRAKMRAAQQNSPLRGIPLSVEHRTKLSLANKGRLFNPNASELCRKLHIAKIGVPLTEEHRKKVSAGVRRSMTPEVRKKMSDAHKGKRPYVMTDEIRKKISESLKRRSLVTR